jgi:hypothetical protein
MRTLKLGMLFTASLASLLACGDRAEIWDEGIGEPRTVGMASGLAVVDEPAHRVMVLEPRANQELGRRFIPVGHHTVAADVSPDKQSLFVLSVGDVPRRTEKDELPSLSMIRKRGAELESRRYPLAAPLSGMTVDPLGRYVAVYAGGGKDLKSFVENPNEIVIVDLEVPPDDKKAVTPRTLRSFGAKPQRMTFTPELSLPGGKRRLLVVETEQYVSLLDLDHLHDDVPRADITVRLTSGSSSRVVTPGGIVIDDGDPTKDDDARIGVRLTNDSNVVLLTLERPAPDAAVTANDFAPRVNLTDVGGVATDISFVKTDGGLRLAAMVPSLATAVLVEPETSVTTNVKLPDGYSRLSLITRVVGAPDSSVDVALLYGENSRATSGVAFWSLGKTSGQAYRSVEVVSVAGQVGRILSVPDPHPELKVLEAQGNAFYVLNLLDRTAAPLNALTTASLEVSYDGKRLWAFQKGATNLASITLNDVHPIPLLVDHPIANVFDLERAGGGRSLLAVHGDGGFGVTVFDADVPDNATAREHPGLLLEGL